MSESEVDPTYDPLAGTFPADTDTMRDHAPDPDQTPLDLGIDAEEVGA